jgi:predicted NodU family carbamoyl transferase
MQGARVVAEALGSDPSRPIAALEAIAASRATTSAETSQGSMECPGFNSEAAQAATIAACAACPQLGNSASMNVGVQSARSALASATLNAIVGRLAEELRSAAAETIDPRVGLTGTAFSSPAFLHRLTLRSPSSVAAPVPEPIGGALGGALLPWPQPAPVTELALGRQSSEQEIKDALENCRLDYVYEPDWMKLLDRVSALLSTGALVGWFHGRRDFGYRSFGSRSVLADPSQRYVRDNVNVFLLRRDAYAPLPISLAGEADTPACQYVTGPLSREFSHAADRQGRVLSHAASRSGLELAQLLSAHHKRTGVAGLVNVPLADDDGLVHDARGAIRASFGSAVDVLVLGRFLVSKDYWLIRGR